MALTSITFQASAKGSIDEALCQPHVTGGLNEHKYSGCYLFTSPMTLKKAELLRAKMSLVSTPGLAVAAPFR